MRTLNAFATSDTTLMKFLTMVQVKLICKQLNSTNYSLFLAYCIEIEPLFFKKQ